MCIPCVICTLLNWSHAVSSHFICLYSCNDNKVYIDFEVSLCVEKQPQIFSNVIYINPFRLSDYRYLYNFCPGPEWNVMCRGCCEYDVIRCKCPLQGKQVGYAVPCCRNARHECDPCIIHPGKSCL